MVARVVRRPGDRALKLDRPTSGDHGGGEQRRNVTHAGERADTARDRSARTGSATGCDAGAGAGRGGTSTASDPEQVRDHTERPDRHERRELTARATHLSTELAAPDAVVHMPPRQAARAYTAIVGDGELLADLAARLIPGLERLGEPHPRAHQQRLDGRHGHAERARHIRVRHPSQFAHEQSRALLVRQSPDVLDQPPQRLPLLGFDGRIVDRRPQDPEDLGGRGQRAPKLIDATVVGDPIEPGAEAQLPVRCAEPLVRADEHVLQRVLGILPRTGQHLARICEQPLLVTVVDDAEGLLVAVTEQRHELLVRAQA
jgi:hypothetical protein